MISVTDIMVGDYLQNTNGNVGKVIGITPYANSEVVMQYHENSLCYSDPKMLQPIAITPAILKKNGWKTPDGVIWYKKGLVRLGWYKKKAELIIGYHTMPIVVEFVHQLQHVIRLLGMEEDIRL